MDDSSKLTRAQRQQIIFKFLKGTPDPLYDVIETKHGKYIVKPKPIEVEEEEAVHEEQVETQEEESSDESEDYELPPPPPPRKKASKHLASKQANKQTPNKRTKQDARRILNALTSIINSSDYSDSDSDDDEDESYSNQRAPPIIEPNNFNPQQLSFRRRRLVF